LEAVGFEVGIEFVEDNAGLDADPVFLLVDFEDLVEVAADVDDEGFVGGLSGETAAAGAGQEGDAVFVGEFESGLDVFGRFGDEDAVGHDLVDAGVGAVEGAAIGVGAEVAVDAFANFV
jgi:hypothetical protein